MAVINKGRLLAIKCGSKDQDLKAERITTAISKAKKSVKQQYVNKYRKK